MSWQGQPPERPLGAPEGHATSIAPPGYTERPSYGSTKASTTPQISVPASSPHPRTGLSKPLKVLCGTAAAAIVVFAVFAYIGHQKLKDLPPGWQNRTGYHAHKDFIRGCKAGMGDDVPGGDQWCGCTFNAIATLPGYDTPQKFYARLNSIGDTPGITLQQMPPEVQTAVASCQLPVNGA
jgi:hypothetical protein